MKRLIGAALFVPLFIAACSFTESTPREAEKISSRPIESNQPQVIDNRTQPPASPELSGWRIYRNDVFGYYFRFPEHWLFANEPEIKYNQRLITPESLGGIAHAVQLFPAGQSDAGDFHILNFIINETDINKVMPAVVQTFSDQNSNYSAIIAAAEPRPISGRDGLLLNFTATNTSGSGMAVNGNSRWAFVVNNNQTYVFGALPGSEIHTANQAWRQTHEGFKHFLDSIVFVQPQDFGDHLPAGSRLVATDCLELTPGAPAEYILEYSLHQLNDNQGGQSTRYLKILQADKGQWKLLKQDSVNYGIGRDLDKLAQSSNFKKITHKSIASDSDQEALFVMKKIFNQEQPYHRKTQYQYYVFGRQANGVYAEFPIARADRQPEQYLSADEINSGCVLQMQENTELTATQGVLEYYHVLCGGNEPHRTLIINQQYQGEHYQASIKEAKVLHQGYFIINNYLWHDGKQLLEQKITALLPGWDEYHVLHTVENNGRVNIYLEGASGCVGCDGFVQNYFEINPENDSATIKSLPGEMESSGLNHGLFYPNSPEIAIVDSANPDTMDEQQSEAIWIYNLLTMDKRKIQDIPAGQTVLICDEMFFCRINPDAMFWDEKSRQLIIKPRPQNP